MISPILQPKGYSRRLLLLSGATIRLRRVGSSRYLALSNLSQLVLSCEIGLRRRGAEQCTCLGLVVGGRSHSKVGVPQQLWIIFDAQIEPPQPQV